MSDAISIDDLFDRRLDFPDIGASRRLARLGGIDQAKTRLAKVLGVLVNPAGPRDWADKHHKGAAIALDYLERRPPLVILAGDVGTGKTELAETVGDRIARDIGKKVTLFPLSLSARGHGAVGEMTTLLTRAFETVRDHAAGGRSRDGSLRHATILLVDEADALAQSRELTQMHHEDRAGVNALIRGIDGLRNERLPVLTIMCTNRMDAIDPAVRRRAAAIFEFTRPDDEARELLLRRSLDGANISDTEIKEIVRLTGPRNGRGYGCTYSDLRQRFVPAAVLDAVDSGEPITGEQLIDIAMTFIPTRPFDAEMLEQA